MYVASRKQDKSQPRTDIFMSHERISIDNRTAIDQFWGRASDCVVVMQCEALREVRKS